MLSKWCWPRCCHFIRVLFVGKFESQSCNSKFCKICDTLHEHCMYNFDNGTNNLKLKDPEKVYTLLKVQVLWRKFIPQHVTLVTSRMWCNKVYVCSCEQAADLTKPIDKRVYKGTFPTCHDFNEMRATAESVMLLVGFTAGQVQLIDPIKKELSKLYNEEVLIRFSSLRISYFTTEFGYTYKIVYIIH